MPPDGSSEERRDAPNNRLFGSGSESSAREGLRIARRRQAAFVHLRTAGNVRRPREHRRAGSSSGPMAGWPVTRRSSLRRSNRSERRRAGRTNQNNQSAHIALALRRWVSAVSGSALLRVAESGRTGAIVGSAAEKPDVLALRTLVPLDTATPRAVGIDNDATVGIATRASFGSQWGSRMASSCAGRNRLM